METCFKGSGSLNLFRKRTKAQPQAPTLHSPKPIPKAFLKSDAFNLIATQVRFLNQHSTKEPLMTRLQRVVASEWRAEETSVGMDAFFGETGAR